MRLAPFGRLLLTLGVIVGTAAGVGLLIDFEPSRLPPALLNIAAYKLTFLAAGGLLAVGAIFLRYAHRDAAASAAAQLSANNRMELAGEQPADLAPGGLREPDRVRTTPIAEEDGRG